MAQLSGDENQEKIIGKQPSYVFYSYIILAVLNIPLSITASIGNILILVALYKESSLHPPSKLLFRCLAVTDLCVGLITQPLFVAYLIKLAVESKKVWDFTSPIKMSMTVFAALMSGVSFLTLTTISINRLLALLSRLRYRDVVTLRRVRAVIFFLCLVSISASVLSIFNFIIILYISGIITLLGLIVSTFCYVKIYATLRRHQAQVQDHLHQGEPNESISMNIARYKKTVSSALYVHLSLVACYLPYVVAILLFIREPLPSLYVASIASLSLVQFNSSLSPVLYCWKIRDVRQAVKETIREFCCF